MTIPLEWIINTFNFLGTSGVLLGIFSFLWPVQSIRLYQEIMQRFHWRADPLDFKREVRNTRFLGFAMLLLSLLLLLLVSFNLQPGW